MYPNLPNEAELEDWDEAFEEGSDGAEDDADDNPCPHILLEEIQSRRNIGANGDVQSSNSTNPEEENIPLKFFDFLLKLVKDWQPAFVCFYICAVFTLFGSGQIFLFIFATIAAGVVFIKAHNNNENQRNQSPSAPPLEEIEEVEESEGSNNGNRNQNSNSNTRRRRVCKKCWKLRQIKRYNDLAAENDSNLF